MIVHTLWLLILLTACQSHAQPFKNWGYQLQGYQHPNDLPRIYNKKNLLWVIDYSADGSAQSAFTALQIKTLKRKKQLVIAYLSIGEAEDFRYYFKKMPPQVLAAKNPEFPDNYKVHYWAEQWQRIFLKNSKHYGRSYLDRILDAQFDGVYLDIIDAFDYFAKDPASRRAKAQQMAEFVMKIAEKARRRNPKFLVIPQNGTTILDHLPDPQPYINTIDGVGIESVFFGGDKWENNPLNINHQVLRHIDRLKKQGKFVLNVEYISDKDKIQRLRQLQKKYHINNLITSDRALKGFLVWH